MSELEKFKRRMIRMVARLHVQEKKPEDELWEYLRKQTKCDCKWLWERMRALTLKRLKRLLIAEDKQENIAAIARMSLTDWLLFDCILVHEKLDVIGTELMAEGRKSEPRPMYELFSLVQRFELEGQSGEKLAQAWTAATMTYNSTGKQCSPMLLQRRWYQLKEVTREKFYNFWFSYRGNAKLLIDALKYKPTRLQAAVAKRYPHIITTPFLKWEELIEQKLVIMPPEFEIQMKSRSGQLPGPTDGNEADLVLVEPEIETIDLGVDSDSDNDLREEVEGSKAKQMIADEDVAAVKSIVLKQEPMDEDTDLVERIDLDADQRDNFDMDIDHMEGIEALQNTDIPVERNEDDVNLHTEVSNDDCVEVSEDETRGSTQEDIPISETNEDSNTADIISSPLRDESLMLRKEEITTEAPLTTSEVSKEPTEGTSILETVNKTSGIENILPIAVVSPKEEPTEIPELSDTENTPMPQIANVFGNVNIPDEALGSLSNFIEKIGSETLTTEEENVDEIEEDIIKTEISSFSCEAEDVEKNESDEIQVTTDIAAESDANVKETTEEKSIDLFSDVIPELTFEDDGIEFIDDGIVEEQDVTHKDLDGTKHEEQKEAGESQSIDLKLLMVPIVFTKKLEHMEVLNDKAVDNVYDQESIERILAESKPVFKEAIKIKEELPVNNLVSDDEEYEQDDLFNRPESANNSHSDTDDEGSEDIPEEKKVNMSSVLFQKPRNRDYSPLVVCKNPDFNTRLKRLTVGFLSYTRNRFLLRDCKPLTIDLCKAFESKLVDNTIYFKEGSPKEIVVKEEIFEADEENPQTPPPVSQESSVTTAVVPTANSVQSLINNMHKEQLWSPTSESNLNVRKERGHDGITERNKVINLPSIDNVRRINQKLLVAEVSPMRVENERVPPVSLLSQSDEKLPSVSKEIPIDETLEKDTTSKTVICSGQVIFGVTNSFKKHDKVQENTQTDKVKKKYSRMNNATLNNVTWRSVDRPRIGFWNKDTAPKRMFSEDQLLTIDTLNKMLHIIFLKDPIKELDPNEKANHNKSKKVKQASELQKKVTEIQKKLKESSSQPPNINTNKQDKSKPTTPAPKPKRVRQPRKQTKAQSVNETGYGTHCCWVRFKQVHPDSFNTHPCGKHCICCCGEKTIDAETDPYIIKVCESIESVIEHSREIVENESFERVYLQKKSEDESIKTSSSAENKNLDAVENVKENKNGDSNTNEKSTDAITANDSVAVYTIEDDAVVDNTVEIETTTDKPEINMSENVCVANIKISVNLSENDKNKDQAVRLDDCVVIDSDESDSERQKTPPVKVTVKNAGNGEPIKRRRGRPAKGELTPKLNIPKYILKPKATPLPERFCKAVQTRSQYNSFRMTRNRYDLRPEVRKQDTAKGKNVLFLDSTHISKRTNHPIFLGKNKILLTDVPLPRNKDKQSEGMDAPALVNPAQPLPQGVNLMLLPNGVLTCTVDSNVQLNPEEITNLGAMIEDIQRRINTAMENPHMQSMQSAPILELLPGMVPRVMPNTNEIVNLADEGNNEGPLCNINNTQDENPSTDNVCTAENIIATKDNSSVTENVTPTMESGPITDRVGSDSDVVAISNTDLDQTIPEFTTITLPVDNTTSDNSNLAKTSVSENTVAVNTKEDNTVVDNIIQPETALETTVKNNSMENKCDKNTEVTNNTSAEQDTQSKSDESELAPKKTILSDLMEMSGIFDDDIAPTGEATPVLQDMQPYTTAPAIETPQLQDVTLNISAVVATPQLQGISPYVSIPGLPTLQIPTQNVPESSTNPLRELTPITSFIELKYACLHNGNFFKLDIETKMLTPINVCIKKKTPEEPKCVVDLTEDADDTENEQNKTSSEPEQPTNEESLPVYIVRKSKDHITPTSRSLLNKTELAKPLKLFKVVHPNILQRSKKLEGTSENIVSAPEVSYAKEKRARKQSFGDNIAPKSYEMQYLNFIASDEEVENYEFDGSFEEPIASIDSSDSSDDEPLAKKVKRRDEAQSEMQKEKGGEPMEIVSTGEEDQATSEDKNKNSELPLQTEEIVERVEGSLENEVMQEEEESALGLSELEFLSDHNDDEEDCILGF